MVSSDCTQFLSGGEGCKSLVIEMLMEMNVKDTFLLFPLTSEKESRRQYE